VSADRPDQQDQPSLGALIREQLDRRRREQLDKLFPRNDDRDDDEPLDAA